MNLAAKFTTECLRKNPFSFVERRRKKAYLTVRGQKPRENEECKNVFRLRTRVDLFRFGKETYVRHEGTNERNWKARANRSLHSTDKASLSEGLKEKRLQLNRGKCRFHERVHDQAWRIEQRQP